MRDVKISDELELKKFAANGSKHYDEPYAKFIETFVSLM